MRREELRVAPRTKALREMAARELSGYDCDIDELGVEGVEGACPLACPLTCGGGSSAWSVRGSQEGRCMGWVVWSRSRAEVEMAAAIAIVC